MRRVVVVSILVLLSATFGALGLLAPAGADGPGPDYPAYPGAPAEGCLVVSPTVAQTGDSVTLTNNCGEAVEAFLNELPFPGGLPGKVTVPCGLDVIRTHTFTALIADAAADTLYSASAELLVSGPGPNCDGVPSVPVYSCPAGSTVSGGSGPTLTCEAPGGPAILVEPIVTPNPPVISCPAGASGPFGPERVCRLTRTRVAEIAAVEVDGELTCPDTHPTAKAGNICSNVTTETEEIDASVTPQAPTVRCPAGTTTNGEPLGSKRCASGSRSVPVRAIVTYVCDADSVSNGAMGTDKVCLPAPPPAPPVAASNVVVQPTAAPAPVPTAAAAIQTGARIVQPAPAPAAVVVQTAPALVTASSSSFGFGTSLAAAAPSPTAGKKATALAHTGVEITYFLYSGLSLIAAGAILLGSRRRPVLG